MLDKLLASDSSNRYKAPLLVLGIVVAYAIGAYTSLEYIRGPSGLSALWTSNAILISGLVLLNGRLRTACLIGGGLACFAVVAGRGATPIYALGASLIAMVVCASAAWLTSKVLKGGRLRNPKDALKLLFLVIIPSSVLSGVASALWLNIRTGAEFMPLALNWFAASVTGTSMILPTALMLTMPNKDRIITRGWPEMIALTALFGALFFAPLLGMFLLALVVVFPAANLFALRLGGRLTAPGLTLITLSLFIYPYLTPEAGIRAESQGAQIAITLGFQLYIMAVFYNGLLTSLAIDHQTRIKRQLEKRTAMARAARGRALQASRAKTQFLAAMSHELRTPLNGVIGFTDILLQRKSMPKDVRRRLELIRRSGDALVLIVNDILDFSRMEAGLVALAPAPVTISRLASDALEIGGAAATAKGLATRLTIEGDQGKAWMLDEGRVRQVLLNLLNNAAKFTETGQIDLRVRLAHGGARFEVSDTGIGVPADRIDTLFDSFTQVEDTLTRTYGGAGLGLAVCKRLVTLMDGRIGVESRLGAGSTFWFEIPLVAVQDGQVEDDALAEERPAHVLVVDDHPVNRELAVTVLGLLGCTTDAVENGAEAVEAMKNQTYDAVLMDVHMPIMDGISATRAIRALGEGRGATPIIGLSADLLPESVQRCMAAGMNDHLGKPVNLVKLQTSLIRCFGAEPESADEQAA